MKSGIHFINSVAVFICNTMDLASIESKFLWCFLMIISFTSMDTFSDMGKLSSSQNHFGSIAQSQFTTKNNTRVIAQQGGLAILPCVVKLNSPATVSWIRRKDFQLLTVGLSTHSSDKRFLVEHTRHMGHWSLRIKSVKEEDRGLYECQLSIYPTQSIFIELKVVEAVAEISGAPDLHIDEGSTLRLECKLKRATENPAFVFWYHDSKMVNYDSQNGFSVTSATVKSSPSLDSNSPFNGGSNYNIKERGNSFGKSSESNASRANNQSSNANSYTTNLGSIMAGQQHQSSYLVTPSVSVLSILEVHFHHAGNYTCAPSNARPSSITVHVLRGEKPAAMQHANRSILDGEINNSSMVTSGASRTSGCSSTVISNGSVGITLYVALKQIFEFVQQLEQRHHNGLFLPLLTIVALIFTYKKVDR